MKELENEVREAEQIVSGCLVGQFSEYLTSLSALEKAIADVAEAHLSPRNPCCSSQLQRLDMEARSFSPDRARSLLQKVKEYKADLAKLKSDAQKAGSAGLAESR